MFQCHKCLKTTHLNLHLHLNLSITTFTSLQCRALAVQGACSIWLPSLSYAWLWLADAKKWYAV